MEAPPAPSLEKVWTGKYLASSEKDMQATVQDVKFEGDRLRFALNVGDQQLSFDGKAAAGGQRFAGTITIGNDLVLTALDASKLTGNDRPGLLKEIVAHEKNAPAEGGYVLLQDGSVKTMTAAEFAAAPKAGKK